jgi:hypothetical protein
MPLGSFVTRGRTAGHLDPIITHEATFTQSSVWIVPEGVYEISAVCVGAGGGGYNTSNGGGGGAGGDLRWRIKIPVTPGESLTVTVGNGGAGGVGATAAQPGGITGIYRGGTPLLVAAGGAAGSDADTNASTLPPQRAQNGTSTTIALPNVGGGLGGRGGWEKGPDQAGGGGGAAGYSGPGGSGGHADERQTWNASGQGS